MENVLGIQVITHHKLKTSISYSEDCYLGKAP